MWTPDGSEDSYVVESVKGVTGIVNLPQAETFPIVDVSRCGFVEGRLGRLFYIAMIDLARG